MDSQNTTNNMANNTSMSNMANNMSMSNMANMTNNMSMSNMTNMTNNMSSQGMDMFNLLKDKVLTMIPATMSMVSQFTGLNSTVIREQLIQVLDNLTSLLNDPRLEASIRNSAQAASVPLGILIENVIKILSDNMGKLTGNMVTLIANIVAEVPGLNIPLNAALSVTNAAKVAKNGTELTSQLLTEFKKAFDQMKNIVDNPNMKLPASASASTMLAPTSGLPQNATTNIIQTGGAKQKLNYLRRKNNKTLKRIKNSIKELIKSNKISARKTISINKRNKRNKRKLR